MSVVLIILNLASVKFDVKTSTLQHCRNIDEGGGRTEVHADCVVWTPDRDSRAYRATAARLFRCLLPNEESGYPCATRTENPDSENKAHWGLPTTHWSVVLAASQGDTPQSAAALDQLCRTYWYPLYAHVRRRGYEPEDAQDLPQEFFARLLARQWVGMADPARARFRTFVLAALDHFLANEWHRAQCQKRGGGHEIVSWERRTGEDRYLAEPADDLTP